MERPHLATRREMLQASGALFAWAYMPSLAQAEGRDPRGVMKGILRDRFLGFLRKSIFYSISTFLLLVNQAD